MATLIQRLGSAAILNIHLHCLTLGGEYRRNDAGTPIFMEVLAPAAANGRNGRIYNDRARLASARNRRRFLLQTYRRDMGFGHFIVMKEVAASITANGKHCGGLRRAFEY